LALRGGGVVQERKGGGRGANFSSFQGGKEKGVKGERDRDKRSLIASSILQN